MRGNTRRMSLTCVGLTSFLIAPPRAGEAHPYNTTIHTSKQIICMMMGISGSMILWVDYLID